MIIILDVNLIIDNYKTNFFLKKSMSFVQYTFTFSFNIKEFWFAISKSVSIWLWFNLHILNNSLQLTKMKTIFVFVTIVLVAVASTPIDDAKNAKLLRYENNQIGNDGYQYT